MRKPLNLLTCDVDSSLVNFGCRNSFEVVTPEVKYMLQATSHRTKVNTYVNGHHISAVCALYLCKFMIYNISAHRNNMHKLNETFFLADSPFR